MKRWIPGMKEDPTVAVVRLEGMIASGRGLNDQSVAPSIEKAFARKPAAVALVINSPGGSPAQSSLIAARIRRLADEKGTKVYSFVEDVAASGGYWLACAGDEIYVDESSVIGSIGVISSGFGLHELIGNYGIERRVHTAGTSKSMNDPFKPEKPEDVERLKGWLEQIHGAFKDHVSRRRAGKLSEEHDLFSGEVWIGSRGIDVGLADGVGHVVPKMKEIFGEKTKFKVYQQRKPLLNRIGAQVLGDLSHSIEERAAYAQFGL